jgi:hypothetical protein
MATEFDLVEILGIPELGTFDLNPDLTSYK